MFEFRIYSPATNETSSLAERCAGSKHGEKASYFILNDSRWKDSSGVVRNIVDADKNSEAMKFSTLNFGHSGPGSRPAALDIVEISPESN